MTGLKQRRGARGEEWAEQVLLDAGMVIIDRNWRCRDGEIDLIAVDEVDGESVIVFCEVKYRTGTGYGTPLESITFAKVRRLRRLAGQWLSQHPMMVPTIRLDAVGVLDLRDRPVQITHVRGIS